MQQQNIPVEIIASVLEKSRATIYRWLQGIRRSGIRSFIKRKKTCKVRRPKAKTPEYIAQQIRELRLEKGDLASLQLLASQGASEKEILVRNMVSNLDKTRRRAKNKMFTFYFSRRRSFFS